MGGVVKEILEDLPEGRSARDIGQALYAAQRGEEYSSVKSLKGFGGRSVLEIVAVMPWQRTGPFTQCVFWM